MICASRVDVLSGRPRVAIECKDHVSAGSPDEMRAFVARLYDLSLLQGHRPAFFRTPPRLRWPSIQQVLAVPSTRRSKGIGTRIATASMLSRDRAASPPASRTMTSYYSIEPHSLISLNSLGIYHTHTGCLPMDRQQHSVNVRPDEGLSGRTITLHHFGRIQVTHLCRRNML